MFFLLILACALSALAQKPVRDLIAEASPAQTRTAGGPRRLALVIGNAGYPGELRLKNPINDANDVSAALKQLQFSVTTVIDAPYDGMQRAVDSFAASLRKGDQAFFYFAGHGIQMDAVNYLVPVDFQAADRTEAKRRGISFVRVQQQIQKDDVAALSVIDACRNNPWGGEVMGLATVYAQLGSYIVFASAPGQTASENPGERNGLFTKFLLEEIRKPMPVGDVFRQVRTAVHNASRKQQTPYLHDQLLQPLVLAGADAAAAQPAAPQATTRPPVSAAARGKMSELLEQGLASYRAGRCEDAYKQFDLATRQDPENPYAQHAAGVALVCQGLRAQAIERFRLALEVDPKFRPAYQSRGQLYLEEANYSLAIEDFTWWIEEDPQSAVAYARRGRANFASRKYEDADQDLRRAVELDPTDAEARLYRGELLHRQGKYRDAVDELNVAVRLRSDWAEAYETRARSRERLGDKAGAERDRQSAEQNKVR